MKTFFYTALSVVLLSFILSSKVIGAGLGASPPIKLIDHEMIDTQHNVHKLVSGAMAGHIVVMNFIYTDCTTVCPVSSQIMKAVYQKINSSVELKQTVRMITLSLNPKLDTPQKMRQFAEKMGIHAGSWLWLTGRSNQVNEILLGLRTYTSDVAEHSNVILVGDSASNHWTSFYQFPNSSTIIQRINDYLNNRKQS